MTETGLAKTNNSAELSLSSKLGDLLRRSSMQTLPKIGIVRAKAIITLELSLLSKLGKATAPKFRRGATASGNSEGCRG